MLAVSLLVGCTSDTRHVASTDAMPMSAAAAEVGAKLRLGADPLAQLPRGLEQLSNVCARDGADRIRDLFCGAEPPTFSNLVQLQTALNIDAPQLQGQNGFSMLGHSTSLAARSISSINPRVISERLDPPDDDGNPIPRPVELEMLALAFSRGEQATEILVRDRVDYTFRFYLLAFRQACNDAEGGCTPGDLLTPEIEQNWQQTSLYEERDLANTVLDCAPCHQPDGPGTAKVLRMQELKMPWTHWFGASSDGGSALLADYMTAKGDETLAGIMGEQIRLANPVGLSLLAVYDGQTGQPNEFDSQTIEDEVRSSAAAHGGDQPADNTVPGESATWRKGYEAARRGEVMTFPYHDVKITDPTKLALMSDAYQAYRRGELDRSSLPDIRDVLPDDPQRLAEMGLMTEPGLPGEDVLVQACSICHNQRLDQSLSRARFRANLEGVSRAERDLAIARLRLPDDNPAAMPPPRLRILSAEARKNAIDALMK
jgi:hypothetical protein